VITNDMRGGVRCSAFCRTAHDFAAEVPAGARYCDTRCFGEGIYERVYRALHPPPPAEGSPAMERRERERQEKERLLG
jgi:hypothetical protein